MEKQEFLDSISQIGLCEDDARRRDMLSTLTHEATALFDNNAELTSQNEALTATNKSLQEYNMKLFLQVGGQKSNEPTKPEEPPQKRSYENLFNEKGELK